MGIASTIVGMFTGNGDKIIDTVAEAADELITSDEERLKLKNTLESIKANERLETKQIESNVQIILEQEATKQETERTVRHKNDMKSDSWLSKNIRPVSVAFVDVSIILLIYSTVFVGLEENQQTTLETWTPLIVALVLMVNGFYFTSRGIEKVKSILAK